MKYLNAGFLLWALCHFTGCGSELFEPLSVDTQRQELRGPSRETSRCPAGADEIKIQFMGGGTGDVRVEPSGMKCHSDDGTCKYYACEGTTLTLWAMPTAASKFVGWAGDCAPSGMSLACSLTLTGDVSVFAAFAAPACTPGSTQACQYCEGKSPLDTAAPYAGARTCAMDGSGFGECTPSRRRLGPYAAADSMWTHGCGYGMGTTWRVPAGTSGDLPCGLQLGPYRSLPAGLYQVEFAGVSYGDATISIDVRDGTTGTVIGSSAAIRLPPGAFTQQIPFWSYADCHQMEFRLLWYGGATVDLASTTLIPM